MTPDDFWTSTFDEVLLVIKGKVDDWRYHRQVSMMILKGMSGKEVNSLDDCPLPYDDELMSINKSQVEEDLELYKKAVANFDNIIWSKS